jgi:predicted DsbA family dithiol-disulfide isomerase
LCPYCAVVDIAMLTLASIAIAASVRGWNPPDTTLSRAGSIAAFAAAIGIPLAVGATRQPAVPEVIARELEKAPPGKVAIVDFVDFECPFCRATHADLSPLLEQRRGQISVARKQVPLPMHGHALDAARAACCGEALGKADDIAEALFAAAPAELTREGCERIAVTRGLPLERFRACMADPATDARIRADIDSFRATQGHGLPTLWIGRRKLEGRQDQATLRAALDDAARAL